MSMSIDSDLDAEKVLDVAAGASEADVRKAYRKRSLKVHPDRTRLNSAKNPDNPTAAEEFHKLTIAAEILLDPSKRAKLADIAAANKAKAQRFEKFDSRRQDLQTELERREKEAAVAALEKKSRKRDAQTELERIREEGKRMRMDKTQQLNEDLERESKLNLNVDVDMLHRPESEPEPHSQERLVRIKWTRKDRPAWTTNTVDSNKGAIAGSMSTFGAVSQVILPPLKESTASGKKPKSASGIVEYNDILGAFGAVQSSKRGVLDGVAVDWVGGVEPESVQELRRSGRLEQAGKHSSMSFAPPNVNSAPTISYETETLMRMKEREKLNQQILEEEGDV
ncbi:hypothetical protein E3P92_00124 [Wallemia ichthyophaga]|nr:hypothetical protein E3P91_00125 [Wallemia ichthyophaga]TIA80478.1 hypothetical protein E3P98_02664 [Wallemia ichthyophaga]TIB04765.1 hypothetical protein E3P95_00125 [Wallemia ichthyophaga]TIB06057.1 hypothetical protein E3P94_00125 [Wallemia ichthyophaga]TIB19182.1 hypothetical protein E3P92_00124 [Wallemia ichthyophaga]